MYYISENNAKRQRREDVPENHIIQTKQEIAYKWWLIKIHLLKFKDISAGNGLIRNLVL